MEKIKWADKVLWNGKEAVVAELDPGEYLDVKIVLKDGSWVWVKESDLTLIRNHD